MSIQRDRDPSHADERSGEPPDAEEAPIDEERLARATHAADAAGDLIDDIDNLLGDLEDVDRALLAGLGYAEGESVDPVEREQREKTMVEQFTQKGGQ